MMIRSALIMVLGMICLPVYADVLYVNVDDANAYSTIQAAVDDASDGDVVEVADGTYTGSGNINIDPLNKAITIRSANGPSRCIIDCLGSESNQGRAFVFRRGETQDTVIEGFTLTGGWVGRDVSVLQYHGGAIAIMGSSPTIRNCIFSGNYARYAGAVLINGGGLSPTPLLENCTFHGNIAEVEGGALYIETEALVTLSNCIVWGNESEGDAAHEIRFLDDDVSVLTLNYCIVRNLDNCLELDGEVVWGPGNQEDDPQFVQAGQWYGEVWGMGDLHIRSTEGRWDDVNELWTTDDVQGPGIDAGDPNSDYTQEYWPNGQLINIGAYGGLSEASMSPDTNGVGDLDGDRNVDLRDLKILTERWLDTPKVWVGDMDLNGVINMVDLGVLFYFWDQTHSCPSPSKMAWASEPNLIDGYPNAVTMTAVIATSTDGTDVQYHFYCTRDDANLDSGWLSFETDVPPTWDVYDLNYSTAYSFRVEARNVGNQLTTDDSDPKTIITHGEDTTPPTPSPAEWETEPNVVDGEVTTMVAVEGTDDYGEVEYYFTCYDVNEAELEQYSSGWQSSRDYTPTDLPKGSVYYFTVKMKDQYDNEGLESDMVMVDLKAPTPDAMTWEVEPYFTTDTTGHPLYNYMVTMTATEAEDDSGEIEYYFKCETSAYSSSWQSSTTHSVALLSTNRQLVFRVKARDKYGNETDYSEAKAATRD